MNYVTISTFLLTFQTSFSVSRLPPASVSGGLGGDLDLNLTPTHVDEDGLGW